MSCSISFEYRTDHHAVVDIKPQRKHIGIDIDAFQLLGATSFNLLRFKFLDVNFEVKTDPNLATIYHVFLYYGTVKFIEHLQREKNFMVIELELIGKLNRHTLSQRSVFWEDIQNNVRKIIEPIATFEAGAKLLNNLVFHGKSRARKNVRIPVIPDFVNEEGTVVYLFSLIDYFIYLSSHCTGSAEFIARFQDFVQKGTDGRLRYSNIGPPYLEPLTLEDYRVPKVESSINFENNRLLYFTKMTHKVIYNHNLTVETFHSLFSLFQSLDI